jgi:hypothetical protein
VWVVMTVSDFSEETEKLVEEKWVVRERVWLFGVQAVDVYTSCRAVLLLCLSENGLASRIAHVKRN